MRRTKIIPEFEDLSGELERAVVAILDHRNTGAGVLTDIEVLVFREHDGRRVFQLLLCHGLPIHEQLTRAAFAETGAVVLEVEPDGVFAGLEFRSFPGRPLEIEQIVEEHHVAPADAFDTLAQEQAVAAEPSAFGDDHAFRAAFGNLDLGLDDEVLRQDVRSAGSRDARQLAGVLEHFPAGRRARTLREEARERRVVERQHIVLLRFGVEDVLHFLELVRHLGSEVIGLRDVLVEVVEFPFVTGDHVRRRLGAQLPRNGHRSRRRHPAVMINGAVAQHLEVLRGVPGGRVGVGLVPRVHHAHAFDGALRDAVDRFGRGDAGRFQDRRHDVDDVVELMANAADVLDVAGPRHANALRRSAAMRRDLFHPFERRVHRPRPAGRKVREGLVRSPELVPEELILHRHGDAIEGGEFVRCPVEHALGARAVVAADVDDQRVVELAHVLDRLNDAADLVVGVREVSAVHVGLFDEELLLLPTQRIPLRQVLRPRRQLGIGGNDAEPLLVGEDRVADFVPTFIEQMLVADFLDPLRRRMMRRMRAAGNVINEERLVGRDLA